MLIAPPLIPRTYIEMWKSEKKVDNALCLIKKVDNDAICPINVNFWTNISPTLVKLIVEHQCYESQIW